MSQNVLWLKDHWFLLALIPPFLWSLCNHIDKHLLSKFFNEDDEGVGALLIVSALASILATPFLYLADPTVLDFEGSNFWVIALTSVLDVTLLWAYLNAMQKDDSSNVIVYYQLVPVLGILTGYIFLGEIITDTQMLAMGVIIFGTSIISIDDTGGKFRFKGRTVGYMLIACSCWAAELAIFKVVAIEENVWRSLFWKHIVLVVLGILMFVFVPKYRASFMAVMRSNSVPVLSLNLLNESLYMVGTIVYGYASLLAPVALVLLTETFQSTFVFLIAIALVIFWKHVATEDVEVRHVIKKAVAIGITGVGTYLLLVA
jgi:uncharacterized membrane protein